MTSVLYFFTTLTINGHPQIIDSYLLIIIFYCFCEDNVGDNPAIPDIDETVISFFLFSKLDN